MKKLAGLAIRLIVSIDCSIGILVYLVCSLVFHEPWNGKIFIFSLFMAHLPDFDLIPYLMIRKRMRIPSHWIVGHHPLIIIPLGIASSIPLASILEVDVWYLASIAGFGVFFHFLHDGVQIQGLHWCSPFSWQRYTLNDGFPKKVSRWFWLRFAAKARQRSAKGSGLSEIVRRIA